MNGDGYTTDNVLRIYTQAHNNGLERAAQEVQSRLDKTTAPGWRELLLSIIKAIRGMKEGGK